MKNVVVEVHAEGRQVLPKLLLLLTVEKRGPSIARRPGAMRGVQVRIWVRVRLMEWVLLMSGSGPGANIAQGPGGVRACFTLLLQLGNGFVTAGI